MLTATAYAATINATSMRARIEAFSVTLLFDVGTAFTRLATADSQGAYGATLFQPIMTCEQISFPSRVRACTWGALRRLCVVDGVHRSRSIDL